MTSSIRILLLAIAGAIAGAAVADSQAAGVIVSYPAHQDVSLELYSIAQSSPVASASAPEEVAHEDRLSLPAVHASTTTSKSFSATAGTLFEGLGTGFPGYSVGTAPPSPTLAVGPNHIVQWVNVHYAIFDKVGNPLLPGPGFLAGNTLWAGFGGVCETTNRGGGMVQYDHLADRWVFSQFAFNVNSSGNPVPPFIQCFAVSTTNDPLGTYNRYAYSFLTEFNDSGKLGVWPDAYYMSYNMLHGTTFANTGARPCAYDRGAMLTGAVAVSLCFPTAVYAGGAFGFLPSDWDGTTPPGAGAPNIFMRQSTAPALRMIKFHVDFSTPANSTFNDGFGGATGTFIALPITLTRACGFGGSCIPQPGTANQLDSQGDHLMYRLQYRKRGTTESLVVTQSEDPAGAAVSALRWYEIRNPFGATPILFQNATYQPDSLNRWMGSIAMDKAGNLAIGYSVSSATTFPGIRITGRLRSEVRNQLQAETTIVDGTGSQTGLLNRWGDYSAMQVDPIDDCTFWYTSEYLAANGTFNWRTKIASFKFPNCQ